MLKLMNFDRVVENVLTISDILHERYAGAHPWTDEPECLESLETAELHRQLNALLRSLPPGVLYGLLAVYSVAHGAFDPGDFLAAYEGASNRFPTVQDAVCELLYEPFFLADRLHHGFELLGRDHLNTIFSHVWVESPMS